MKRTYLALMTLIAVATGTRVQASQEDFYPWNWSYEATKNSVVGWAQSWYSEPKIATESKALEADYAHEVRTPRVKALQRQEMQKHRDAVEDKKRTSAFIGSTVAPHMHNTVAQMQAMCSDTNKPGMDCLDSIKAIEQAAKEARRYANDKHNADETMATTQKMITKYDSKIADLETLGQNSNAAKKQAAKRMEDTIKIDKWLEYSAYENAKNARVKNDLLVAPQSGLNLYDWGRLVGATLCNDVKTRYDNNDMSLSTNDSISRSAIGVGMMAVSLAGRKYTAVRQAAIRIKTAEDKIIKIAEDRC